MMRLVRQISPKSCNIACLQMVGLYFGKDYTEEYITRKLQQHSFGNWLPEMAIFLKKEGIETSIYINATALPKDDNANPSLRQTLEEYSNVGDIRIEKISESVFNEKPSIININRSALHNTGKGKAPHYVVLMKKKTVFTVFDPLCNEPFTLPFQKILSASYTMNKAGNNGLLLLCK